MSEKIKQLLEQQEAMLRNLDLGLPTARIQKILSMSEMYRPGISASQELAETVARIQSLVPAQPLLSDLTAFSRRHGELFRSIQEGMPSYFKSPAMQNLIELDRTALKVYEDTFRMPVLGEIAKFGISQLNKEALVDSILSSQSFRLDLQEKMEAMRSPWLNTANALGSAQAFAEIHAIGRLVNGPNPFADAVSASLRLELGDWRDFEAAAPDELLDPQNRTALYVERGFNAALTDFTNNAFDEGLESAGIREPLVDGGHYAVLDEGGIARNQKAFDTLMRFEILVRRFIADVMLAHYGEDWMKHQLPPDMLDKWRAKADSAIKAGYPPGELIDYADFTDYRLIIERRDNWRAVFQAVFARPEDIRESFQRLFPVRIATMHARIITLDDELFLRSETRRVLRAIQKSSKLKIIGVEI